MTDRVVSPVAAGASPALRRVAIDPVTRVEGHGKVTLLLDADNRVVQARLHIVEFRGFERFVVGRPYWELPVMVQRLCGICPVSHHLAACKALDAALGFDRVPPVAEAMRRLMHHGQILQSHALHFFHLSSPDLLFGFASEPARRNILGVAQAHPDIAREGVLLRKFGQEVIRLTSGKRVHGTGAVPGGVNRHLGADERDGLAVELPQVLEWCERAVALAARLYEADRPRHDRFGHTPAAMLSIVGRDGAMDLYDGHLRARNAAGGLILDGQPVAGYLDLIEESVRPWSYMKFPALRHPAGGPGWYRVGPLARVQNVDRIPTPRAEGARQRFLAAFGDAPVHAVLATHWARMIEMLHAAEVIAGLLDDEILLAADGGPLAWPMPAEQAGATDREGVGVIEAPRGTLIHHYTLGADDRVTSCNLIVSTTHNNDAMQAAVCAVAADEFDGRDLNEGMLNAIEVAIRAYDPCLSCATHALGDMPLEVSLARLDGQVLDRIVRQSDGRIDHAA
jgi:NAD-reducing hydrogenase large subunit